MNIARKPTDEVDHHAGADGVEHEAGPEKGQMPRLEPSLQPLAPNADRVEAQGKGDGDGVPLALLTNPADTILFMDNNSQDNTWNGNATDVTAGTYYGNNSWGNDYANDQAAKDHNAFDKRHTGGGNIPWYDGHTSFKKTTMHPTGQYPNGSPSWWYVVKPSPE